MIVSFLYRSFSPYPCCRFWFKLQDLEGLKLIAYLGLLGLQTCLDLMVVVLDGCQYLFTYTTDRLTRKERQVFFGRCVCHSVYGLLRRVQSFH